MRENSSDDNEAVAGPQRDRDRRGQQGEGLPRCGAGEGGNAPGELGPKSMLSGMAGKKSKSNEGGRTGKKPLWGLGQKNTSSAGETQL